LACTRLGQPRTDRQPDHHPSRWPAGSAESPGRAAVMGLHPGAGHGPVVAHRDGHLHVIIHGRTAAGVAVKVYGGIPFADCAGLIPLALDESEGVSLDEIYTLLGLLRDHQSLTVGVSA